MKLIKQASSYLLLGAIVFASCNNANENESKTLAEDRNEEKFSDNKNAERNAQFLVDVTASNQEEIQLARLAQQKSRNNEVVEIAKTLENDHTAMGNEIKEIATAKSISLPSDDNQSYQDKLNKMNEKNEADFNKDWVNEMIDMHKAKINKLESASDNENIDPEIRAVVNNALPKVKMHLEMLQQCQDNLKNQKR
jgi:putative membrane protein